MDSKLSTLEKIRKVVTDKRVMCVCGINLDPITALMIMKTYDKLNPIKKVKFEKFTFRKMLMIACKDV
jgi:hypothetical protein